MATAENHLIDLLPPPARERLLALCEPVQLTLSDVLYLPGQAVTHVYFPVDGFASLVAELVGHPGLEVGMVGREGLVGAGVLLGLDHAPLRVLVQGPGSAWRVGLPAFRRELAGSPVLQQLLLRYLGVLMVQLASAAVCVRFHRIGERLARWLLMSQDRAHGDSFHVTHEFLSCMLGVRRVGITTAASALQRDGLIHYRRGEVTVVDRAGLAAAACSCYASDCGAYRAALGG